MKKFWIWIIVIAFFHIGLVLFFGSKKEGFHEDEYYTYWSVSSESIGPSNFAWNTGYGLQSRFFVKEGQQFSFDMVVQNQAEDVHPPLYYLFLHTFMSFFSNSFYKWFGILLNLVFSLATYIGIIVLFYSINGEIIKYREHLALLAGLVYAVSPSTISCVMLTRMYAMSTMWTVLYAVLIVMLMNSDQCSRRKFFFLVIGGATVCYCAFLTHYFALLFPFSLTLVYCIYTLVKRKGIVRMLIYGVSMLLAIGLAVCTFPACITHIFGGYRGKGAWGGSLFGRIPYFTVLINRNVFAGLMVPYFVLFLLALILVIVLVSGKKKQGTGLYIWKVIAICISCLLSYWLLTKVALAVEDASCRYFYPVMAVVLPYMVYIMSVALLLLKETFMKSNPEHHYCNLLNASLAGVTFCLLLIPIAFGYYQKNIQFLYEDEKEKKEFSEEYSEYPLIMVYNSEVGYISWYVDDQLWPFENIFYVDYEYIDEIQDEKLLEAEKIVVYMDAPEESLDKLISDNPNLNKSTLVRHDSFYYVYLLE